MFGFVWPIILGVVVLLGSLATPGMTPLPRRLTVLPAHGTWNSAIHSSQPADPFMTSHGPLTVYIQCGCIDTCKDVVPFSLPYSRSCICFYCAGKWIDNSLLFAAILCLNMCASIVEFQPYWTSLNYWPETFASLFWKQWHQLHAQKAVTWPTLSWRHCFQGKGVREKAGYGRLGVEGRLWRTSSNYWLQVSLPCFENDGAAWVHRWLTMACTWVASLFPRQGGEGEGMWWKIGRDEALWIGWKIFNYCLVVVTPPKMKNNIRRVTLILNQCFLVRKIV